MSQEMALIINPFGGAYSVLLATEGFISGAPMI